MEDSNLLIKKEICSFIDKYKKDDIYQQRIALEIEDVVKNIVCFFCLDQKECWDYRDSKFKGDTKGDFYIKKCMRCIDTKNKNIWIKDCSSFDLLGITGIKLFRYDACAGSDKFKALEDYVIKKNPELVKPQYIKSVVNSINKKESTRKLDLEIGNIMSTCKLVIESYNGDINSVIKLMKDIKVNILNFNYKTNTTTLLCEQLKENHFMYVIINNNSTKKTTNIIGIYKYEQFNLDIDIDIFEIKTLNDSAHHLCSKILNDSAERTVNKITKLLNDFDLK